MANTKTIYRIAAAVFIFSVVSSVVFAQEEKRDVILPARYENDRIFVEPVLESGEKIVFYTDTGGGLFIYKSAAERLKLIAKGDKDPKPIDFPKFTINTSIPAPIGSNGKLFVFEPPKQPSKEPEYYGMLGQAWFADRIWKFDYPNKQLVLLSNTPEKIERYSPHNVKLGFKTDENGKRILHFPRISIAVDCEEIDLLFDTGATTSLNPDALALVKDGLGSIRATSFITQETFDKWRERHPRWRVIENAESATGEAMIEVPRIKIANHVVGPVWFTRRANKNFHEYMTRFMDKRVEGAVGGNILRHFRVTVDYPKAIANFEK